MAASDLRNRSAISPEVNIPRAPAHLQGEALVEWKRVSTELKKLSLISKIDRAALAMYCITWARHVEAERKLAELGELGMVDETPNGFKVQGVWLNISNKAMEQCLKFLAEFGMSPASRARATPSDNQPDLFANTEHEKPTLGSLLK